MAELTDKVITDALEAGKIIKSKLLNLRMGKACNGQVMTIPVHIPLCHDGNHNYSDPKIANDWEVVEDE